MMHATPHQFSHDPIKFHYGHHQPVKQNHHGYARVKSPRSGSITEDQSLCLIPILDIGTLAIKITSY